MSKAGEFEIRVIEGGHPIWAQLHYRGKRLLSINSLELLDLAYATEKARIEAKHIARRFDPNRIEDY